MPLTAEEKNQIAQGSTAATAVTIGLTTTGGLLASTAVGSGFIFAPLLLGLQAEFGRVRSPKFPRRVVDPLVKALRRRGLEPRISADPFFGDVVISTRDQDPFLDELVRASAIRRVAAQQDTSDIFFARQRVGEELARTAEARGFRTSIDPNLRGGVFRATAESPLQFIEGDFLNAPR